MLNSEKKIVLTKHFFQQLNKRLPGMDVGAIKEEVKQRVDGMSSGDHDQFKFKTMSYGRVRIALTIEWDAVTLKTIMRSESDGHNLTRRGESYGNKFNGRKNKGNRKRYRR